MNRQTLYFIIFCAMLFGCQDTKKCNCVSNKYSDLFHRFGGIPTCFDLNEAKNFSKLCNKPILIDFVSHSQSTHEVEWLISNSNDLIQTISEDFIFTHLYLDDRTIVDSGDFLVTNNYDTLKSIGKINSYIESVVLNGYRQPILAIYYGDRNLPTEKYSGKVDEAELKCFLSEGIRKYKTTNY